MNCEFCSGEKNIKILSEFDKIEMRIDIKNSLLIIYKKDKIFDGFIINYCPVCGKVLPQGVKGAI